MLTRRIIVCLDVAGGRVVKGVRFEALRDVGNPVVLAARYEAEGADEITFLDIAASAEDRATTLDLARATAERLFIPLALGGGIGSADQVAEALRAGADKVSLNSAAVRRPEVLTECADRFGAQCVIASIDGAWDAGAGRWLVRTHGGRRPTGLDAVEWAVRCAELGAGEILLTSIDADGARTGYDLAFTRAVAETVAVPVIASGGAGRGSHLVEAFGAGADAALVAGILHDGLTTVHALKVELAEAGIPIRRTP